MCACDISLACQHHVETVPGLKIDGLLLVKLIRTDLAFFREENIEYRLYTIPTLRRPSLSDFLNHVKPCLRVVPHQETTCSLRRASLTPAGFLRLPEATNGRRRRNRTCLTAFTSSSVRRTQLVCAI